MKALDALAAFVSVAIPAIFFGQPLQVIVACAAGTYCSFAFSDPVKPRLRMLNLFVVCIFMGAAFTALVNAAIGYWLHGFSMTIGLQAGVGAVVSCLTQFFLVWLIEIVKTGRWITWIPFFNKKQGD